MLKNPDTLFEKWLLLCLLSEIEIPISCLFLLFVEFDLTRAMISLSSSLRSCGLWLWLKPVSVIDNWDLWHSQVHPYHGYYDSGTPTLGQHGQAGLPWATDLEASGSQPWKSLYGSLKNTRVMRAEKGHQDLQVPNQNTDNSPTPLGAVTTKSWLGNGRTASSMPLSQCSVFLADRSQKLGYWDSPGICE